MFVINKADKSIFCTRGDVGLIKTSIRKSNGELYTFSPGDVVRFRVYEKNGCSKTILLKDVEVEEATTSIQFHLTKEDTKIGKIINNPVEYWYEMELNPETNPQTFVGYDSSGAKIFKLFPEGSDT